MVSRSALVILLLLPFVIDAQQGIRDLKARFHPQTNSIFVEWTFPQPLDNIAFNIRYRTNRPGGDHWKTLRSSDTMVRLNVPNLTDGDELHVQVNAERAGRVIEDWSQVLVITVTKKMPGEDPHALAPPTEFTAIVQGATRLRLEWRPVDQPGYEQSEVFHIVNVKQLTTQSGGVLQRQQIKSYGSSFTMGRLIPGERYELTIRSAVSDTKVSPTAAIVEITMPLEDEFFEVGDLIISTFFKPSGHGVVNLTWEVPPTMAEKIRGYDVKYSEVRNENWQTIKFDGAQSSASLDMLKSDTEYMLRIKTLLRNNFYTESTLFRFQTPKVTPNPIRKVDVIYSHEVNSVRLQWMLEPHISLTDVTGYDVYISENKDLPESRWRHIPLHQKEAQLALPDLKSLTTYFIRVNIRNADGTVTKSPTLYRFKTIDKESELAEVKEANALSYRNLVPGKVAISWTYPASVLARAVGSVIYYTENKHTPVEMWQRMVIPDAKNTSIVLSNLREGSRYYVKILPRLQTGDLDHTHQEEFEMHTDTRERFEEQMRIHHPSLGMQQMKHHEDKQFMRITSCDPDAIVEECAIAELCVSRTDGKGWCIPYELRDAILNS